MRLRSRWNKAPRLNGRSSGKCRSRLVRSVAKYYDICMTEARINRRLAAILAADVVGYSRLMANDEAGTLATLKRYRV